MALVKEVMMFDLNPDSFLTRDKAALALSERGFPISKNTLSTLASRGNGPSYRRFGRRVLYRLDDLVSWANARCSASRTSTSEFDAQ